MAVALLAAFGIAVTATPAGISDADLLGFDSPDHDAALGWLLASGAVEDAQRLAAALSFF